MSVPAVLSRFVLRALRQSRPGLLLCLGLMAGTLPVGAAGPAPQLRLETGTHTAAIRGLARDAAERMLLTVSDDKTARLWSPDGRALAVLRPPIGPGAEGRLYAGALSPDGGTAALGGYSAQNDVYLFDTASATMRLRLAGHGNVINALAFSPDSRWLAVCLWGRNGLVLYQSKDHWKTAQWAGGDEDYEGDCYGLSFRFDSSALATSSVDGRLRRYDLREGSLLARKTRALPGGGRPFGLRFSPDGQRLAVGFEDRARVEVLNAEDLSVVASPSVQGITEGNLSTVAWSGDGRQLFAAGTARRAPGKHLLRQWSLAQEAAVRDQVIASDTVTELQPGDAGGVWFASAAASWGQVDAAGELHLRQAPPIADFRASRESFGLRDRGRKLAFAFAYGGVNPARFDLRHLVLLPGADEAGALGAPALTRISDWQDSARPRLAGTALKLELGEISLSAAEDLKQQRTALGTSFFLRFYDGQGKLLWRTAAPAPCFALAMSDDGRWVIGGFGDGSMRWFATEGGAEKLALFVHADRKRWVLWTPEGRFSASEGGAALVGWHLNRGADSAAEFLPFERFSARHFDPAGLAALLVGERPQRPVPDLRDGLKLPPQVRFVSPREGQGFTANPVRIELSVSERGGALEELRLFHNGKRLAAGALREVGGTTKSSGARSLVVELHLEPGRNEFRAVALGKDHTESEPRRLQLDFAGVQRPARLHLVVVGINRYKNAALNLDYSVPDARSVAQFFRGKPNALFESVELTEIYDAQATKAGLLEQLKKLQGLRAEDVVVVYLAGHGEALAEDWYFIPHDALHPEKPEVLKREGLSSRELAQAVTALPARKVVVMIDACKSGAALAGFRGLEERRALAQLSRATGVHLVAATTKDQLASEVQALGHGVFTYTLLEGLKGKAAGGGRDVTARKLISFVEQALPELTLRHRAEEQYPVAISRGMDFPLVLP